MFQNAVLEPEKVVSRDESEQFQKKLKDAEDDIKTSIKLKVRLTFVKFGKN